MISVGLFSAADVAGISRAPACEISAGTAPAVAITIPFGFTKCPFQFSIDNEFGEWIDWRACC
jgi:hypothetical protein